MTKNDDENNILHLEMDDEVVDSSDSDINHKLVQEIHHYSLSLECTKL